MRVLPVLEALPDKNQTLFTSPDFYDKRGDGPIHVPDEVLSRVGLAMPLSIRRRADARMRREIAVGWADATPSQRLDACCEVCLTEPGLITHGLSAEELAPERINFLQSVVRSYVRTRGVRKAAQIDAETQGVDTFKMFEVQQLREQSQQQSATKNGSADTVKMVESDLMLNTDNLFRRAYEPRKNQIRTQRRPMSAQQHRNSPTTNLPMSARLPPVSEGRSNVHFGHTTPAKVHTEPDNEEPVAVTQYDAKEDFATDQTPMDSALQRMLESDSDSESYQSNDAGSRLNVTHGKTPQHKLSPSLSMLSSKQSPNVNRRRATKNKYESPEPLSQNATDTANESPMEMKYDTPQVSARNSGGKCCKSVVVSMLLLLLFAAVAANVYSIIWLYSIESEVQDLRTGKHGLGSNATSLDTGSRDVSTLNCNFTADKWNDREWERTDIQLAFKRLLAIELKVDEQNIQAVQLSHSANPQSQSNLTTISVTVGSSRIRPVLLALQSIDLTAFSGKVSSAFAGLGLTLTPLSIRLSSNRDTRLSMSEKVEDLERDVEQQAALISSLNHTLQIIIHRLNMTE